MLREEILQLFVRMADAMEAAANGDGLPARLLHEEMRERLRSLPYVEKLGVPFDP